MINTNQAREAAMISAASYNYNEPANKQSPLPAGYKLTVNPNKNDEVLARGLVYSPPYENDAPIT